MVPADIAFRKLIGGSEFKHRIKADLVIVHDGGSADQHRNKKRKGAAAKPFFQRKIFVKQNMKKKRGCKGDGKQYGVRTERTSMTTQIPQRKKRTPLFMEELQRDAKQARARKAANHPAAARSGR